MELTTLQEQRIEQFVPTFKRYLEATDREADLHERHERTEMLSRLLSAEGLEQMTELEFGQVISSLWASLMWGNKGYLVERLLNDNGLSQLQVSLRDLLWGNRTIAARYDDFRKSIKGFGAGMITEILAFVHPEQFGLWNNKARQALFLLGFEETFPTVKKSQIVGKEYEQFNALMLLIQGELAQQGLPELDLLGIDYFLFEVWKAGWESRELTTDETEQPEATALTDFDHDDMIEQIIAIGQWLGFEVHKEKPIALGAKVDAVWQARIANLGVVTYVFEVQRRGSYDSLILNLQRAQNNPSVQRLIVVAMPDDLTKIRREIETLSESFRRSVGYMEVAEVMRAAELVTELTGIINKLELVKGEFGV
ncbi:MAG: hypothetical protein MUO30_06070 [Anaerolineales bacterium]|nr:hypothetical protein [Anaerolineales bacterium]